VQLIILRVGWVVVRVSASRLAGQLIAIDFEVADLGNGVYAISDVSIPR